MKRILSLILAVMMIASLAVLSVSAAHVNGDGLDVTVIDATGGGNLENKGGDVATVTKKYFAVSYTMTASTHAGYKGDDGNDNGCCGLTFDGENDCIYIPYDGDRTDTQCTLGIWGGANVVFGNWWGGSPKVFDGTAAVEITPDTEVTVLVLGVKGDDGKTTVTAYVNGTQVNVWGKELTQTGDFAGNIGWATKLAGQKATVMFAESDTELTKDVFASVTEKTDTPANPDQGGTEAPVAPKTGEATAIVALVSVLALAGVVVASKKRA